VPSCDSIQYSQHDIRFRDISNLSGAVKRITMEKKAIKEAPLPAKSAIDWSFGTAANEVKMPQPHMGFYWGMPADAPCIFSIHGGVKKPRTYGMLNVPPRRHYLWPDDQLLEASTLIRCLHGDKAKSIVRPVIWEDLYKYFDPVDLWTRGAWNLWRLLHLLCDENEAQVTTIHMDPDYVNEIIDWAYAWCTNINNQAKLRAWNQKSDILTLMSAEDWKNLDGCSVRALTILRHTLGKWHNEYKNGGASTLDVLCHVTRNEEADIKDVQLPTPTCSRDGMYRTYFASILLPCANFFQRQRYL
jgi:hypothetical protein